MLRLHFPRNCDRTFVIAGAPDAVVKHSSREKKLKSAECSDRKTVRSMPILFFHPKPPNQAPEPTCLLGLRFRILLLRSAGPRWSKSLARPQPHVAHL